MQRADYTLGTRRNRKSYELVSGFGGYGAGGGTDDEPFGGAGDAAEEAATAGDAQGVVTFAGKGGTLLVFVG